MQDRLGRQRQDLNECPECKGRKRIESRICANCRQNPGASRQYVTDRSREPGMLARAERMWAEGLKGRRFT